MRRAFKPAVFVACAVPAAILTYRLCQFFLWEQTNALGPDPANTVIHETGRDALGLLLITLSVTPLRRLFKLNWLQSVRRMLGVWSFTYAVLHLSSYLVFNQLCYSWATCDLKGIVTDVLKRKFIFMGMFAWTILFALAITSTSGWVRRLKKKWQTLHRLAYVAAIAGVIHFAWGQKADIREPLKWGAFLAVLLAFRVYLTVQKRRARAVSASGKGY
jgi:sulfoxide reductase heme-binding subunit YedZ